MVHAANVGDMPWQAGGTFIGSRGQGRQIEGFAIRLTGPRASQFNVHYNAHIENVGDVPAVSNGAYCGTKGQGKQIEGITVWFSANASYLAPYYGGIAPTVAGLVHMAGVGDVSFSNSQFAGSKGKAAQLEGFTLQLSGAPADLGLEYMVHAANVGDMPWQAGGTYIGSRGQGRAIEGFAIRLTGPQAGQYIVNYNAHVANVGDIPAVTNGAFCGTRGQASKIEGITVWITANPSYVPATPTVSGLVHAANIGDVPFSDSKYAGTKGRSAQLEGFELHLNGAPPGLGLEYMVHAANVGDVPWQAGGTFIGSRGQGRALEGFAVRLTGHYAPYYTVHYSAHVADVGDVPAVTNGTFCGTRGQARRMEGFTVWLTVAAPSYSSWGATGPSPPTGP